MVNEEGGVGAGGCRQYMGTAWQSDIYFPHCHLLLALYFLFDLPSNVLYSTSYINGC